MKPFFYFEHCLQSNDFIVNNMKLCIYQVICSNSPVFPLCSCIVLRLVTFLLDYGAHFLTYDLVFFRDALFWVWAGSFWEDSVFLSLSLVGF